MTQDASMPHNIFEAASRAEKERREKQVKMQAPPPAAKPAEDTPLTTIFHRCQQLHKEIAESLDQAFKQGGITSTQVRTFVSRPQNFSGKDWQRIETQKKKNEEMLLSLKKRIDAARPAEEPRPPTKSPEEPPRNDEVGPSTPAQPSPGQPPPQPPPAPKKARIMTRRQWIGM